MIVFYFWTTAALRRCCMSPKCRLSAYFTKRWHCQYICPKPSYILQLNAWIQKHAETYVILFAFRPRTPTIMNWSTIHMLITCLGIRASTSWWTLAPIGTTHLKLFDHEPDRSTTVFGLLQMMWSSGSPWVHTSSTTPPGSQTRSASSWQHTPSRRCRAVFPGWWVGLQVWSSTPN